MLRITDEYTDVSNRDAIRSTQKAHISKLIYAFTQEKNLIFANGQDVRGPSHDLMNLRGTIGSTLAPNLFGALHARDASPGAIIYRIVQLLVISKTYKIFVYRAQSLIFHSFR
ncbi:hypothetical protein COOONC_04483 [Cooperia oncophora]